MNRATTSHSYCHAESTEQKLFPPAPGQVISPRYYLPIKYICTLPRGHTCPHDWETVGLQVPQDGPHSIPL